MKNILLVLVISLFGNIGYSQLSVESQTIKDSFPKVYKMIKDFASRDWSGDHEMMVYAINKQSDAINKLGDIMRNKSYDKSIMNQALINWTDKGLTDYTMVLYEYNKQLRSKGAY